MGRRLSRSADAVLRVSSDCHESCHSSIFCSQNGQPNGQTGPLDPTKDVTYEVVKKMYDEAAQLFEDQYMFVGGDEVSFACWQSNPSANYSILLFARQIDRSTLF